VCETLTVNARTGMRAVTATRNTFVAKGGLAVVLACLRRTPLVEDNAVQARWLTSVLWTVSCDAIHGQALADCDLIHFVQDVLQVHVPQRRPTPPSLLARDCTHRRTRTLTSDALPCVARQQLKVGVCSWAKANVSGFVQCMSQIRTRARDHRHIALHSLTNRRCVLTLSQPRAR
jgi:hypothetical protein